MPTKAVAGIGLRTGAGTETKMKTRRHHNNKGTRQIKRGKTAAQVKRMARRLGIAFGTKGPQRRGDGAPA